MYNGQKFVYVMRPANGMPIVKVGISDNLERRKTELERACGMELKIIWVLSPSSKDNEEHLERLIRQCLGKPVNIKSMGDGYTEWVWPDTGVLPKLLSIKTRSDLNHFLWGGVDYRLLSVDVVSAMRILVHQET